MKADVLFTGRTFHPECWNRLWKSGILLRNPDDIRIICGGKLAMPLIPPAVEDISENSWSLTV